MICFPLCLCVCLCLPQASSPKGAKLARVRVVDQVGRPLEGAEVLRTQSWRSGGSPDYLLARRQFPLPEVLDRGQTDANGVCALPLPPAMAHAFMPPRSVLFVTATRYRTECLAIVRDDMPAGPLYEVRLTHAHRDPVTRLRLPDGEPAAGLIVRAIGVSCEEGIALLPDELIEEAKSDASGNVRFRRLRDVATIEVLHPRLGRQVATRAWDYGMQNIRLKKAAPLIVQATGESRAAVAGLRVRIWTNAPRRGRSSAPPAEQQVMGYAEGGFDGDGRLEVGALAEGTLVFDVLGTEDAEHVPQVRWGVLHASGNEAVGLPVVATRVVRGKVVDAKTKDGVPGVVLHATVGGSRHRTRTGRDGSFSVRVFGARPRIGVVRLPAAYRAPATGFGVPEGVDELPPIEISRGRSLRGRVVDAAGDPMAGAFVVCRWKEKSRFGQRPLWRAAFSDDGGRFRIEGVHPGITATVVARSTDAKSNPITAEDGMVLRLGAAAALTLSGRVTDQAGQPVPGAAVTIESQTVPTGPAVGGARHQKAFVVTTDEGGRWIHGADMGPDYRVRVDAKGFAAAGSPWYRSRAGNLAIDCGLRRLVTLRGRIVDNGTPVAGAEVACPRRGTRAATGADGTVRLEGVPEGEALVVVRSGHLRSVHVLGQGATLDIGRARRRRGAPVLPLEQRLALAARVIAPRIEELEKSGKLDSDLRVWQLLAAIDPAKTLARLETRGLAVPWYDDAVRRSALAAVEGRSVDEALAVCETLRHADRRALHLSLIAKRHPSARTRDVLFEALLSARRIQKPDMRLCVLSRIGEGFLDAGDRGTALRVFEEAFPLVQQLPDKEWPGYARACFAADTAVLDLDRSLAIVAGMTEMDRDRHHANIAHEIAAWDPAGAKRVMEKLGTVAFDRTAPRVCACMARKDLARARRLAAKVGDAGLRAYALGAMAKELRSEQLLDEAFAALGEIPGRTPPAVAGGMLLDFVAEVAPRRLDEAIARSIALLEQRGTDPREGWRRAIENDCTLACCVALHDVDTARALLREAIESRSYLLTDRKKYDPAVFFHALALVEPRLAARTVEEIAEGHPQKSFSLRSRMRQAVATTLATRTSEQLRARVHRIAAIPELEEDQ